jgi:hypothetical protein
MLPRLQIKTVIKARPATQNIQLKDRYADTALAVRTQKQQNATRALRAQYLAGILAHSFERPPAAAAAAAGEPCTCFYCFDAPNPLSTALKALRKQRRRRQTNYDDSPRVYSPPPSTPTAAGANSDHYQHQQQQEDEDAQDPASLPPARKNRSKKNHRRNQQHNGHPNAQDATTAPFPGMDRDLEDPPTAAAAAAAAAGN